MRYATRLFLQFAVQLPLERSYFALVWSIWQWSHCSLWHQCSQQSCPLACRSSFVRLIGHKWVFHLFGILGKRHPWRNFIKLLLRRSRAQLQWFYSSFFLLRSNCQTLLRFCQEWEVLRVERSLWIELSRNSPDTYTKICLTSWNCNFHYISTHREELLSIHPKRHFYGRMQWDKRETLLRWKTSDQTDELRWHAFIFHLLLIEITRLTSLLQQGRENRVAVAQSYNRTDLYLLRNPLNQQQGMGIPGLSLACFLSWLSSSLSPSCRRYNLYHSFCLSILKLSCIFLCVLWSNSP